MPDLDTIPRLPRLRPRCDFTGLGGERCDLAHGHRGDHYGLSIVEIEARRLSPGYGIGPRILHPGFAFVLEEPDA